MPGWGNDLWRWEENTHAFCDLCEEPHPSQLFSLVVLPKHHISNLILTYLVLGFGLLRGIEPGSSVC